MEVTNIIEKLPRHPDRKYPNRPLTQIKFIDIHHSASWTKDYQGIQTIKNFAHGHINDRKWPGLGYNYVVGPDGRLFKTGYDAQMRWSVGNHNRNALSLMLIGMFNVEDVPEKQWEIATLWVKHIRQAYGVGVDRVKGHREFSGHNANQCPGFSMERFRDAVNL